MKPLIDFDSCPLMNVLKILLADKTTKKNIIWATDTYSYLGAGYGDRNEIAVSLISGINSGVIHPRIQKSLEEQSERIKKKAEVFTPAWICNKMNNFYDNECSMGKTPTQEALK